MATSPPKTALTRRTALAGLGAGGLGLALAALPVAAADASNSLAHHPIIGVWMVATPGGPALAVFSADGTNVQGVTTAVPGQSGVTFTGMQVGTWEPDGDRRAHFTGVQLHTDVDGTFTGTVTIDGHPRVSEDGMTFIDDAPETTVTIRDAENKVVNVITGGPPATGVRMGVGVPGFPEGTPAAGTPTS